MRSFELIEFHHHSQEFHRPDQPDRESFHHGASSPGLPLPTAIQDDRVEEIYQDQHVLLPPFLAAREVVPQLSPSCASLGMNAGILPSVIASNLHQEAPPKAHPCTSFNASFVVDLPSINIATMRESMSHQRTLFWDLKLTSRWAKIGLTTLSKLPLFNKCDFLLAKQAQCN